MYYIIGIDPGKHGAVAVVDASKSSLVAVFDTPLTGKGYDKWAMMLILRTHHLPEQTMVYIEKQSGFQRDSHGASFTTGFGYGIWITLLDLLQIPYKEVLPRVWQKRMGVSKNCYGDTKKVSLKLAKANFPEADFGKKDGRSDAALIAIYGALLQKGCVA